MHAFLIRDGVRTWAEPLRRTSRLQRRIRLAFRFFALVMVALSLCAAAGPVHAQQGTAAKGRKGLYLAARKKCDEAVPLLEEAELAQHRPELALALADCYAAQGKLLEARDIYAALADEKPTRRTRWADRVALRKAKARLKKVDDRIPTLAFETPQPYEDLEVFVNGDVVTDPFEPRRYQPGQTLRLVVRAKGRQELRDEITLGEGERMVRPLVLEPQPAVTAQPAAKKKPPKRRARPGQSRDWIGARFRGYLVPKPMWSLFGDGGRTFLAPGGALTYTADSRDNSTTLSLGYTRYALQETPFKSRGTPDTDYEIIESDLQAVLLTLEYSWREPLNDSRTWELTYGGGIGVGWMFSGQLTRTQAYPRDLVPGDPYAYSKCKGPNDPAGSFRYCNQLDHDADHYNYAEPSWFEGGKRPLLYPWLALPQLALTHYASNDVALDLELGLTLSGLLVGMGIRVVP